MESNAARPLAETDATEGGLQALREGVAVALAGKLADVELARLLDALAGEAKRAPTPELAKLISDLLDHPWLGQRELAGDTVKVRLLQAQQALGFPWALEVKPEDLELLKPADQTEVAHGGRVALGVSAVISALWSTPILWMAGPDLLRHKELVFASPFVVAMLHAVAAAVAAFLPRPRKLLRVLGWMWLFGPLAATAFAVSMSGDFFPAWLVALLVATPSMVTAWIAMWHSRPRK